MQAAAWPPGETEARGRQEGAPSPRQAGAARWGGFGDERSAKGPLRKRKNNRAPAQASAPASHQQVMGTGGCLVGWDVLLELGHGDFLPVLPKAETAVQGLFLLLTQR